jgi:hypothetical protein
LAGAIAKSAGLSATRPVVRNAMLHNSIAIKECFIFMLVTSQIRFLV